MRVLLCNCFVQLYYPPIVYNVQLNVQVYLSAFSRVIYVIIVNNNGLPMSLFLDINQTCTNNSNVFNFFNVKFSH